jgi:hypothetical protein
MSELASAADAPAARAVIYTMGFDQDTVQHALEQAGGNEQLAINLILNGAYEASIAAPAVSFSGPSFGFGTAFAPAEVASSSAASSASSSDESSSFLMSPNILAFPDHLIGRTVSLALFAHDKLKLPSQLRAQIMRPLELVKAAAWFSALRSPGIKRQREEPPLPLGHVLAEFSPRVPVRVMCGCVATASRRLATAPAGVHVFNRTTGRWAGLTMDRVTRGRMRRVQVRLQRRACCACLRCVVDACCSKRWLIFRSVAAPRSGCIKRAAAFILASRLLLPPALQADASVGSVVGGRIFCTGQEMETVLWCFAM